MKVNSVVLAEKIFIYLDDLIENIDDYVYNDESIRETPAKELTDKDWEKIPSYSVNFKVYEELQILGLRLKHDKVIDPRYYINISEFEVKNEKSIQKIISEIESKFQTLSIFEKPNYINTLNSAINKYVKVPA